MPETCYDLLREQRPSVTVHGRKDEMREIFGLSCAPRNVQPNFGRVQKEGAAAYVHQFRKGNVWRAVHRTPQLAVALSEKIAALFKEVVFPREIPDAAQRLGEISPAQMYEALESILTHLSGDNSADRFVHTTAITQSKRSFSSFLESARRLEAAGHIDRALDMIYAHFDTLLRAGEFERVNDLLDPLEPHEFGTDSLLGLLTITLPANSRLPARAKLFHKVERELRSRDEWEDGLLSGLEP